ncbi:MAG: PEP-CTERM sorting domain-containing protein [Alphaproteobacteria bacterium]|nr:PEP-CTERM sorting domain-containing protein [Alphaproteobacteria bacterium]
MQKSLIGAAGFLLGLVSMGPSAQAATINNDTLLFQGTLSQVTTILVSPSGHVININDQEFNVNNTTYDGLAGFDTIFFTNFGDFLEAGAVQNVESFVAGNGNDVIDARFSNVQVTLLGGTGNDIGFGSAFFDILLGDSGDDILDGHLGADFLDGGRGNDLLIGGGGADTYSISGFNELDTIIEAASDDINVVQFAAGVNIDSITFENAGTDLLLTIAGAGQLLIKGQFDAPDSGIDTLKFRGGDPFDLRTLSGPQLAVAEPGTLAFLGLGVAGLALTRRRRPV